MDFFSFIYDFQKGHFLICQQSKGNQFEIQVRRAHNPRSATCNIFQKDQERPSANFCVEHERSVSHKWVVHCGRIKVHRITWKLFSARIALMKPENTSFNQNTLSKAATPLPFQSSVIPRKVKTASSLQQLAVH